MSLLANLISFSRLVFFFTKLVTRLFYSYRILLINSEAPSTQPPFWYLACNLFEYRSDVYNTGLLFGVAKSLRSDTIGDLFNVGDVTNVN